MGNKIKFDKKAIPYLIGLLVLIGFLIYWRQGVEKIPGDVNVRAGNYRLEDGLYDEAAKQFSEALQKSPDHVMARLGLATTYMQTGRDTEALQELNLVIELKPDLAAAFANSGILYNRSGQHAKTHADYRKALAMDSEIPYDPGVIWCFLTTMAETRPHCVIIAD